MKYIQSYNESLLSVRKKLIDDVCKKYNIRNYNINDDLSVDVADDVDLVGRKMTKIPLKFGQIEGLFDCSHNKLTTLIGCPKIVGWEVIFDNNLLTHLDYYPERCMLLSLNKNKITNLNELSSIYTVENNTLSYDDNPLELFIHKLEYIFTDLYENEIRERLDEFEVIKDINQIDLISLNSLFDFYNIPFYEKEFKNIKGYVN